MHIVYFSSTSFIRGNGLWVLAPLEALRCALEQEYNSTLCRGLIFDGQTDIQT